MSEIPIASSDTSPRIVYGKGADHAVKIYPDMAADTMRDLGVSEQGIAKSVVYIDPINRTANNGTHYSPRLARLRFMSNPAMRGVEGDVVRISTKVRGKDRTDEQMNKTLTHELEHLAQADRHDKKVTEGHIAIYGLAALGAMAGNRLGKGVKGKVGSALGGFLGYQLGYWLAPHERQARLRAGQVNGLAPQVVSKAIRRKN